MDRRERDRLVSIIDAIPIEEEVSLYTDLRRDGSGLTGLCPLHQDSRIGSFKVKPGKQWWTCFACGQKGVGPISFYMAYHHCKFTEAVIGICREHNISTTETLINPNYVAQIAKAPRVQAYHSELLPPDELSVVYRTFIDCAGPMDEAQSAALIETRHLRPSDLCYFFTFPKDTESFMEKFLGELKKKGIGSEQLKHVPGFYYDQKKGRICFLSKPGSLGIIANDQQGRINGIQIRQNTDDHKKRYLWFSSGFADGNRGRSDGTAMDKVVDYIFGNTSTLLACTEGKFKAIKLNEIGYTVLNMHGVSSWPADKVIEFCDNRGVKTVDLFYDADFHTNDSVARAAIKFSQALIDHGLNVRYVVWEKEWGKGVDDAINNGYLKKLCRQSAKKVNENILLPLLETGAP